MERSKPRKASVITDKEQCQRPSGRLNGIAYAEFERQLTRERTRAGMQAARRRGRRLGRPPSITLEKLDLARRLIEEGRGRAVAARMIGVDPATLRRALNGLDDPGGSSAREKFQATVREKNGPS